MKQWKCGAAVVVVVASLCGAAPVLAQGIPVFDAANVTQSVVSAVEDVAQTLKQIEQYTTQLQQLETQLQQYANQVLNTEALASANQIWTSATNVMNRLNSLSNTLEAQKARLGNLDAFLASFKSSADYQSSCLGSGCTKAQTDEMGIRWNSARVAVKDANDAVLRGADEQAASIDTDAANIERMQSSVRSAQGQVAALQANGQLGAAQADQLLKIRSLLIAQGNAQAVRDQAENDRKSAEAAAGSALRGGTFSSGGTRAW